MVKAGIKLTSEIEAFKVLNQKVEMLVKDKQELEEDYGDIPEEFQGKAIVNIADMYKDSVLQT